MRVWSLTFIVVVLVLVLVLVACGRTELSAHLRTSGAAGSGEAVAGRGGRAVGPRAEPPAAEPPPVEAPPVCRQPEAPVNLGDDCAAAMCACDHDAFNNCGWECWAKVICRIATCNNAPTHRECAEGCPDSSPAELSLGQCYEDSDACLHLHP